MIFQEGGHENNRSPIMITLGMVPLLFFVYSFTSTSAYEDLVDNLEDVIDMLRKRASHSDILEWLKVKGRNPLG